MTEQEQAAMQMALEAYEVPLVEQLESVPNNARLVIDDADGMGTRFIPVGRMCHEAATALRRALEQQPAAWIGLDASDWNDIAYSSEFRAGAEWADAKLREKNGGKV